MPSKPQANLSPVTAADPASGQFLPTRLAGVLVLMVGLVVVTGWLLHWERVIQLMPTWPPMKFNTACGFILCGAGLVTLTIRSTMAVWPGLLAALLGGLILAEYLTGISFGLDELGIKSYITTATAVPGRMSALAATCFTLIGLGLAIVSGESHRIWRLNATGLFCCVAASIALVAVFGFAFGIEAASGWGAKTRMALHTALTFILLATGLLFYVWQVVRHQRFHFLRWLPTSAALTVMVMIACVAGLTFQQLQRSTDEQKQSHHVLVEAGQLLGHMADLQRGRRSYVLTGKPEMLEPYYSGLTNAPAQLNHITELVRNNPEQTERLKTIAADLAAVIDFTQRLLDTSTAQGLAAAIRQEGMGEGLAAMNRARATLQDFVTAQELLLNERSRTAAADFQNTGRLLIGGSVLAAVLLLVANIMASREMSLRRRVETRLSQVVALQKAILQSANYAIISTTAEGVVTLFNSTAERWLGYTAAEIVDRQSPAIWHDPTEVVARSQTLSREMGKEISPGFDAFVAKARLGLTDENEWTFIRKDGSRFPVLLSVTALTDNAGAIRGFLGVIGDISERKQREVEREKLITDLRQALAEVKTLSGFIPICGWCKNIRSDKGFWLSVEQYVHSHTEAKISHGICPDCSSKFEADAMRDLSIPTNPRQT